MPRAKGFIARIGQILTDLEAFPGEKMIRSDIERIFQIPGSSAKNLMSVVGAARDEAHRLTVSRDTLLQYLKCSPEGRAITAEASRRRKFAANLTQARQEWIEQVQPLHQVEFRVPTRYKKTRLRDLRQVSFEPGELRIRYAGRVDLASTLMQLSEALANDWSTFESVCDFTEQQMSNPDSSGATEGKDEREPHPQGGQQKAITAG